MIFSKNNIDFRQVSSNAQSNFLKSKSFILTEITSVKGWQFSDTAKEVVLQSFKVLTTWVFELEEYSVTYGKSKVEEDFIDACEEQLSCKGKILRSHMICRNDWYDKNMLKILLEVQDLNIGTLRKYLLEPVLGKSLSSAYNKIVNFLISFMNHLLFILHEIDYLIYNSDDRSKPFIYLDNVDVSVYIKGKEFFPSGRLKTYQKLGLINSSGFNVKLGVNTRSFCEDIEVENAYNKILIDLKNQSTQILCVL